MNEKEAIEILEGLAVPIHEEAAYDMAVEALKKQIPKKPEYKEEDRFVKNHFAWYTHCPQCGCEINAGDMHCTQCGQAIDWSEEE